MSSAKAEDAPASAKPEEGKEQPKKAEIEEGVKEDVKEGAVGEKKESEVKDEASPAPPPAAKTPPPPAPKPAPFQIQMYVWFQAMTMMTKYSKQDPRLRRELITVVGVSVVRSLALVFKMIVNELQTYAQNSGQFQLWVKSMSAGIASAILISFTTSWHKYAEQKLANVWRDALTTKLHSLYFSSSNFYQIAQGGAKAGAITDADVRFTDDLPKIATSVSALFCSMISGAFDSALFSVVLARMGRGSFLFGIGCQAYAIFIYLMSNYWILVDWAGLLGRSARSATALKQAIFRAETHSEAICSYHGGAMEKKVLAAKLKEEVAARIGQFVGVDKLESLLYYTVFSMFESTPLLWFTVLWGGAGTCVAMSKTQGLRLPQAVPWLQPNPFIAENYGAGIRRFWAGQYVFGGLCRVMMGLHQVLQSFASIQRIQQLEGKLLQAAGPADSMNAAEGNDRLEFKDVSIHTPSGELLVDKLSFGVRWGQSLLLTGQNGAGKSSIFRCMGGLWPVQSGSIWRPVTEGADSKALGLASVVYYLPQRPYNALGTLAEQFCYPDPPPATFTEDELRQWLDFADLGHLADIPGALSEELDWETILSRGEQQRLGIVRMFWKRPRFAVLDECTSAVSGEMEKRLFDICPRLGISCITIAHRPALLQYHQQQLNLTGQPKEANGGWTLVNIPNGAACFDPEAASGKEAKVVVKEYLAQRDVKLKGVLQEETREVVKSRKEAIASAEAAAKEKPAGFAIEQAPATTQKEKPSKRGIHPDFFIGLKQPGARWRLILATVCLLARTHVNYLSWTAWGKVIARFMTYDVPGAFRALAWQTLLGWICCALDRVYKRSHKHLVVMLLDGLYQKAHDLVMNKGAMHYATSFELHDAVAASVDEIGGFAASIDTFVDMPLKQILTAFYGAGYSVASQGWPVLGMVSLNFSVTMIVSKLIQPNYADLFAKWGESEGKLKTVHSRFRQNLEPIAFSSGGLAEQRIIEGRYEVVQKHSEDWLKEELTYKTVQSFLTEGDMLPLSLMRILSMYWTYNNTGAFRTGMVSGKELEGMFIFDRTTTMFFNSMGAMMRLPELISVIFVGVQRLSDFFHTMEDAAAKAPTVVPPSTQTAGPDPSLAVQGIDVVTPKSGEPLALKVGFEVDKTKALVITGPNASGKSLLGGYIAGLRPLPGASPSISVCGTSVGEQRPHMQDLLRTPQRPYLPLGGLGDQVAYPLPGAEQPPARLQECLDLVGIGYLVERHGGLETVPELPWDEILSGGEQQRIGVARCLFHKPVFGILDECTSMVSQETELSLYTSIVDSGTIPVTISQRLSLPEMHSQELQLGCGTLEGWELSKIDKKRTAMG